MIRVYFEKRTFVDLNCTVKELCNFIADNANAYGKSFIVLVDGVAVVVDKITHFKEIYI